VRGDPFRRVEDEQDTVDPGQRPARPQEAEVLDRVLDLHLSAHPGGIDDPDDPVVAESDQRVHGIAGRSRRRVDYRALLAQEPVQDRGLPDVGTAHDRDRCPGIVGVPVRELREPGYEDLEEVPRPPSVQGRQRYGITETEAMEDGCGRFISGVVDLVGGNDDRLVGAPEDLGDLEIVLDGTQLRVDHQHDHIGSFDGDLGLLGDARVEPFLARLEPAGIDDLEPPPGPVGDETLPVARHSWGGFDDRLAPAQDPVHKGRLPDVRTADHGHQRQPRGGGVRRHADCFRTSSTISAVTSSIVRPVVSIATAPEAWARGDSALEAS
jgi:hypothetical protein